MKLSKFLKLLGYGPQGGDGFFNRLRRNGLMESVDYQIKYTLHKRHIYLTAEGMAMVNYIIGRSRCKQVNV